MRQTSDQLVNLRALASEVDGLKQDAQRRESTVRGLLADVGNLLARGSVTEAPEVPSNFVFVKSKNDLPKPSGTVISLANNYTYFFTGTVDLEGNQLSCGQNTTLLGGSSENCRIKSTGLTGKPLIISAWSLPIRNITIEAEIALELDASLNSNQALDWFGVNFTDCTTVGNIIGYNNVIMSDCAFLNSGALTFDGTIGTIGFNQCIFDARASSTVIALPSTLTVSRRFRIIYSAFVVASGETGVNASTSATIPVEGYILDTVNFSGGGTYTTGVTYTDNKALWVNNKGINNSTALAYYTMNGNATATTVASANVEYKAAGTTTDQTDFSQKFTHSNNRATYAGAITRVFRVSVTATITSGNNHQIGIYIAKNGSILTHSETYITTSGSGRAENTVCQALVTLATNDYIEVFVENATSATNITVTDLSVIATPQS